MRGVGGVVCGGQLPGSVSSLAALQRLPVVELRHQAALHGIKNGGVIGRSELVVRLSNHYRVGHDVVLDGDEDIVNGEEEVVMEDLVMETEEEQVVPLQQKEDDVDQGTYILEQAKEEVVVGQQTFTIEEQEQYLEEEEEVEEEEEDEEDEDEDEGNSRIANIRYKIGGVESEIGQEMMVQVLPKQVGFITNPMNFCFIP